MQSSVDAERGSELTLEAMRCIAAQLLDRPQATIGDDDDLVGLGIDSVRIMRFANELRRWGVDAKFRELVEEPSVRAWWAVVEPRRGRGLPAPVEVSVDEDEPFALAPMQQAYWVGRTDGQALGGVAAHFYAELDGNAVEPGRLTAAVHALLRRHGMLRARFLADGTQQIMAVSPWEAVTVHRFDDLPDAMVADELERVRQRLSHRRFDVERGEVFDVQLSVLPRGRTRLHLNIDMLVADASSFQLILGELAVLYSEPERPLPSLGYTFPRYLATLPARRADARARAVEYWDERLPEMPGGPQLPLATDPRHLSGARVGRRFHVIDRPQWDQLADRSRSAGLTLPVTFATAFAEVIGAWRLGEAVPPQPAALRPRDGASRRAEHRRRLQQPARARNRRVRRALVRRASPAPPGPVARRHRPRRATRASRCCATSRASARTTASPRRWCSRARSAWASCSTTSSAGELGEPGWTTSQTPQVWLDQQVTERDGGLLVNWDVVEALFPVGMVDAMFAAYVGLLEWLAGDDADWGGPVPGLVPAGQLACRAKVNATEGARKWSPVARGVLRGGGHGPGAGGGGVGR